MTMEDRAASGDALYVYETHLNHALRTVFRESLEHASLIFRSELMEVQLSERRLAEPFLHRAPECIGVCEQAGVTCLYCSYRRKTETLAFDRQVIHERIQVLGKTLEAAKPSTVCTGSPAA